MVAHDGVEQAHRELLAVVRVVSVPPEMVSVEAEPAPVIQDSPSQQLVLLEEPGGLADRLTTDRSAQLLDEPETAYSFDLRHTLLTRCLQGTELAWLPSQCW